MGVAKREQRHWDKEEIITKFTGFPSLWPLLQGNKLQPLKENQDHNEKLLYPQNDICTLYE